MIVLGAFSGYLTAAYLTDVIGRKQTLILFAACSFLAVIFYSAFPVSNGLTLRSVSPWASFLPGHSAQWAPTSASFFRHRHAPRVRLCL